MEHGKLLCKQSFTEGNKYNWDNNLMKFVGYEAGSQNECEKYLFHPSTIKRISDRLTYLLRGVDPQGKKLIVTDDVITNALSGVFAAFRPQVGDIYSRYTIMNSELWRNDAETIIDRTITLIFDYYRNEIGMEENNKQLTVWTTILGDFNKHGLRQTPPIKTQKRRPDPFLFNMNY
jgi:hypothetical protein